MKLPIGLLIGLSLTIGSGAARSSAAEIDFNRDVRVILSDKCYHCHGPDGSSQEADLRLDSRETAADVIESGELLARITSDDPDIRMPPPDSKLSLTEENKQTIRQWVEAGAEYAEHWAFELLPSSVEVPKVPNDDWSRQPLDRFVLKKLRAANLPPNSEAAPLRWLRRATLDLTGLPPTVEQTHQFEQRLASDDLESVYVATVNDLLDSPAFGEQLAISWLDVARYADSYGYQSDKLNTQWPYRDWVVNSINHNLPYDQFLTWQLAGDLLPTPSRDQLVATAFNRIHRLNNEGGAVFEEWRLENVADRVHTFGTAMLGLTLECCRCHDHKYDPIPTRDYYALSAFFNSIDESGVYDRHQKVPCPSLLLPTPEQTAELKRASEELQAAERRFEATLREAADRFATWNSSPVEHRSVPVDLKLALTFDRPFDDSLKAIYHPSESDRKWTTPPALSPVEEPGIPRFPAEQSADFSPDHNERMALTLDGERGVTTHGIEPFDRWTPFTVVMTLSETARVAERSLIAHHTRGTDCGYNGWDLTLVDGHLESRMYRVWPGNAIGVRTQAPLPLGGWHQVAASYDGSSQAAGLRIYVDGKPVGTTVLRDSVKKSANVEVDHGGEFVVGQRFRSRGFAGGQIDDVQVYSRALTAPELLYLSRGEPQAPTAQYYASAIDRECRAAMQQLTAARRAYVMAEEVAQEIPIMQETSKARPTHVLARGAYDAPTDDSTLVPRSLPTAIHLPLPEGAPHNRLGLARWVTHPRHPLTARVAVNRLWGNFFTDPLVRTPENFGSQGELPTHPELLDFLARDFIDGGWDVKRLCQQIVLSSTYRQDSAVTKVKLSADPSNRLLARGPAHRLSAEQIRDLALAASGLINHQRGGPPVSPYQPGEDLWRESNGMSPSYQQSVGKDLYRRSLYSVWKRTAPLPNMLAFDATPREVCTVKRARTNTPLQALVLLNDVQFIEASRKLAERVLTTESGDRARIERAFRSLTGRRPDTQEAATLLELLADETSWFGAHPHDAAELIGHGESAVSAELDSTELAAMTVVCQTILNLDAATWKR